VTLPEFLSWSAKLGNMMERSRERKMNENWSHEVPNPIPKEEG
jgi:hypothetical protein